MTFWKRVRLLFKKKEPEGVIKAQSGPTSPGGDVIERDNIDFSIFKATIPRFLYKPPFGYPRPDNPPLLKQFARNGFPRFQ